MSYGLHHYIVRTIDNKIDCWGNNFWTQLGNGRKDESATQQNIPELNQLLSDLNITVIKCGINAQQIGCGDNKTKLIPTKVKLRSFHVFTVGVIMIVDSWGCNDRGQLGL